MVEADIYAGEPASYAIKFDGGREDDELGTVEDYLSPRDMDEEP